MPVVVVVELGEAAQ
jgi:hypothetical protein